VFHDIFTPFRDRENLKWLGSVLSMESALRIVLKVLQPILIYILFLQQSEYTIFLGILVPFAGAGFIVWQRRSKLGGLKKAFVQSMLLVAAGGFAAFLLVLIPGRYVRLSCAVAVMGFVLFNMVTGYILPNPITAKLADVASGEGKSLSGSYFGAYLFTGNIASALGDVVVGFLLAGTNSTSSLFIGLCLPVAAALYLVSALVFRTSKMN
jgi:Na+/melibiose symporter-like transporter